METRKVPLQGSELSPGEGDNHPIPPKETLEAVADPVGFSGSHCATSSPTGPQQFRIGLLLEQPIQLEIT